MMTSMSHTYGNVLAWVQKYVLDLMPEDTFKTIHVNSKIAHRQLRSTNHEFLKKTKPMIIFRPRIAGIDEDRFLKGTPLIERQYDLYNTYGGTNLQAFFNDPKAIQNTYVIPVVMTSQSGFDHIFTGTLKEGATAVRTDASVWDVTPKDYVLYCVKFQNKYSGFWLTHGNTSTDNIEKAGTVEIKTRGLNQSVYTVSMVGKGDDGKDKTFTADMLLTFDGSDKCTISSLTDGVTVTGNGSWGDDSEKKSWGDKDRDGMELSYSVDFGGGNKLTKHEKLVWQRSGVKFEEFSATYVK